MQGDGAVAPGTHRDALAVQQHGDVQGLERLRREADAACAAPGGTQHPEPGQFPQFLFRIAQQGLLPGGDAAAAHGMEIFQGRSQPGDPRQVQGARLEFQRRILIFRLHAREGAHHAAPGAGRR